MTWLNLALGLVRLVEWLVNWLHDAKVFKAAEMTVVAEALDKVNKRVAKAIAAGEAAEANADQGVFDPDLFRRD